MENEDLVESDESSQWCLVGRFLTERSINLASMQNTLVVLRKPVKGVWIKDLGSGCCTFSSTTRTISYMSNKKDPGL